MEVRNSTGLRTVSSNIAAHRYNHCLINRPDIEIVYGCRVFGSGDSWLRIARVTWRSFPQKCRGVYRLRVIYLNVETWNTSPVCDIDKVVHLSKKAGEEKLRIELMFKIDFFIIMNFEVEIFVCQGACSTVVTSLCCIIIINGI
jgi:hypothetical protein